MSGLHASAVAIGAALGALLRWRAGLWFNTGALPWGTLVVNIVGGLLIGVAMVAFMRWPSEGWRLFAVTGFLGGLTTFSAFSGESLAFLQRGQWGWAAAHTLAHVLGALVAAGFGFAIARPLLRA